MLKFLLGVLLIGAGVAGALLLEPIWGMYLFAALTHIRLEQLGENYTLPLRIPIFVAGLTLVLYVFGMTYKEKFSKWPAEVWLFGLMVAGMAVSASQAEFNHDAAWTLTFDYLKYWIFFLLMIQMIDTRKRLDGFYWTLILSSAWLVFRAWDLRGETGPRFENLGGGSISDSNHYAAALVLLFPFVFQRTFSRDWKIAGGAAVLCFGIVMAIVIANSRGAFLGLITLSLLILWLFKEQRTRNLVALAALAIIAFSFATESQIERLFSVFSATEAEQRDNSSQLRLVFWDLAFQLFKEHPLTGVGPDNFRFYSGFMVEGLPYGTPGHVTHSLWFEMLSQGGLLMCVPFLILLWRFFRNSWRLAKAYVEVGKRDIALYIHVPMIALAAFLVSATFLDRMVYEPMFWCIALGAVNQYLWGPVAEVGQEDARRDASSPAEQRP